MDRDSALSLVKEKVSNKNLIKHMLACEVLMRELARTFSENEEKWGLAGLLHDLDYDLTFKDLPNHGITTAKWLDGKVDADILQAIAAHPGHFPRVTKMDKALYAVDPITGFVVACALIHPDKKLSSINEEFIIKRMDEKRFAAGADREQIKACSELGLSLQEFVAAALRAMRSISKELGL